MRETVRIQHALVRATPASVTGGEHDIVPLVGKAPWLRMRVGSHRVLFRPVTQREKATLGGGYIVGRVIHRRDLVRAAANLE